MLICSPAARRSARALLFGLFPALHSTRPDLAATLKNQAGQPGGAQGGAPLPHHARHGADRDVDGAAGAGRACSPRACFNVSRVDLGLKTDHMVIFGISPELNGYNTERTRQLFERIEDELAALPGVTGVAAAMVPVLAGDNWGNSLVVEGFEAGPDTNTNASFNGVGPGYFRTMGIPLMSGREFTRADAFGAPKVGDRQPGVREEVQPRATTRSASALALGGPQREARYRDRRPGAGRQVQRGEARGAAAVLPAVPAGRASRASATSTSARRRRPSRCCARSRPSSRKLDANLPVGDIKTMDAADQGERVGGSHHQHAVARLRAAGDGAGGDRPLRRARLHGGAAHARVRPAHGARRRRRHGARHGDEAGG